MLFIDDLKNTSHNCALIFDWPPVCAPVRPSVHPCAREPVRMTACAPVRPPAVNHALAKTIHPPTDY